MKAEGFNKEDLCAFLDSEVTEEEAKRIEYALARDPKLREQLEAYKRSRSLVRLAFKETRALIPRRSVQLPYRVATFAAVLLLVCGGIVGALVFGLLASHAEPPLVLSSAQFEKQLSKMLIHLSDGKEEHLASALNKIEALLLSYETAQVSAKVEVIVNADGIKLLRADTSPFKERVHDLQDRFSNLRFLVCGQTLERLRRETGREVQLLPGVVRASSALDHVLARLREGWGYIRV